MTQRLRLTLSIVLSILFFGCGIVSMDFEHLITLLKEDDIGNEYSSFGGYLMFRTIIPIIVGAAIPWIGWYRSPLNPRNHSSQIKKTGKAGVTMLHIAAMNGHKKHAEVLIANGADINAQQKYGNWTPLDLANYEKKNKVADLLRKHGGKTCEELKAEGK